MESVHTISSLLILETAALINDCWFEEGEEISINYVMFLNGL